MDPVSNPAPTGGTVKLSHNCFIVTSNYSIDELQQEDETLVSALKRWFDIHYDIMDDRLTKIDDDVKGKIGVTY